ncbi:MAG: hypothetical protein KGQ94_07515 [Alphaproteobacteria bacterium]|nr:hypothetical protein [Alphaproteobacteria bacterium]
MRDGLGEADDIVRNRGTHAARGRHAIRLKLLHARRSGAGRAPPDVAQLAALRDYLRRGVPLVRRVEAQQTEYF